MKEIKNICVYCSSSNSLSPEFYKHGEELGEIIAKEGFNFVYGGSKLGLMYKTALSAKNNGAKVIGIMPKKLYDLGESEAFCNEFYLTEGMRERKALLDEKSDAVIALAGGFGTLEEVSEMIVQKQLCYNSKPIVFVNTEGFYNDLLKFFENIVYKNFANKNSSKLYYIAETPKEAIEYIKNYKADDVNFGKQDLMKNIYDK